jgi:hypothetical protein
VALWGEKIINREKKTHGRTSRFLRNNASHLFIAFLDFGFGDLKRPLRNNIVILFLLRGRYGSG